MIYENNSISNQTLRSLGVRNYMSLSLSDFEVDISTIESFLDADITNKEFLSILGKWGNTCIKRSKTIALLEYIRSSKENAQKFLKFSQNWVLMMASLNKPGFYDGRNEMAVKECIKVSESLYLVGDCKDILNDAVPNRFKYLVEYSLHRTIMQTLTEIFLRGMLGALEVLGREGNIEMLVLSYDVSSIDEVFCEFVLPLI